MSSLKIDISALLSGAVSEVKISDEIEPLSLERVGEPIVFKGPVRTEFTLIRTGRDVDVTGTIKTEVSLACSRCLRESSFLLDTEVDETYYGTESFTDENDFRIIHDEIDLFPMVNETINLSLPFQPLCRKDCKGLCSSCGQDLNEAECGCPREKTGSGFAVLKDLFELKKDE